jgi:hypothetical protein
MRTLNNNEINMITGGALPAVPLLAATAISLSILLIGAIAGYQTPELTNAQKFMLANQE